MSNTTASHPRHKRNPLWLILLAAVIPMMIGHLRSLGPERLPRMSMERVKCSSVHAVELSVTDGTVANMIRLHAFDSPRIAPRMGRGIEYNDYAIEGCGFWSRAREDRLKVASLGIAGSTRGGSLDLGDVYDEGTSGRISLTAEERSLSINGGCKNDLFTVSVFAHPEETPPVPLARHMSWYLGRETDRLHLEMKNSRWWRIRILDPENKERWRLERK